MKILVIGSGGREHAIAWKVAQNSTVEKVYCAPGNGGTFFEDKCENIPLTNLNELISFAKDNHVELTIVGPEEPLTKGFVDEFRKNGLAIFGPSKEAAKLEGSKIYSKDFMKKYGVKTAEYASFDQIKPALEYIKNCCYPVVVKADGLAAGKGVVICENAADAESTLKDFMINDIFAGSGKKVVIEEFLDGVEASILSITDGNTIIPFISSKDHKQIYDENKGPNTGGMGAIAPNPYCTNDVLESFDRDILQPTLKGIKGENLDYIGIIFFGVMITKKGVYLLEYNVRLGDPETQAVLPIMESDLVELIQSALKKDLSNFKLTWKKQSSCCIVAASGGYPASYAKGYEISCEKMNSGKVFVAGAVEKDSKLVTSGGRVLCVQSLGDTAEEAKKKAYDNLKKVSFKDMYFRKDIGTIYEFNR
ncbi:phosphoribosylamine--glycine ligase [Clostridium oryzae]|uniref:Phosphoribosylamine--glycine ligase n=1 Tax=Clostridium oryzae TaxID=1450648 RepID=A0A1V4ICE7_9CLOT|nr:phosphoribosylamine--glycine ligase [Clostridium oryzae]OPJ57534.1 phosphoribosylamine--glycine ligase [Clostridium oryzae]